MITAEYGHILPRVVWKLKFVFRCLPVVIPAIINLTPVENVLTVGQARKRKKNPPKKKEPPPPEDDKNDNEGIKTTVFEMDRLAGCQTNFTEKENYQKAVCFTPNGFFFVSGGTDGHLRIWLVRKLTFLAL